MKPDSSQLPTLDLLTVFKSFPLPVIVVDSEWIVRFINRQVNKFLGTEDEQEFIGKYLPEVVKGGNSLTSNPEIIGWSEQINGRPLTFNVSHIMYDDNRLGAIITISLDEKLKNVEISGLLAGLFSEMLGPLSSISGYSELFLNGKAGVLSETQMNFMKTINKYTQQLKTLRERYYKDYRYLIGQEYTQENGANTACTGQVRALPTLSGILSPTAGSASGGFFRQIPRLPVTPVR